MEIKYKNWKLRPIAKKDDASLARIIKDNLESYHLDIPGTAYFDPELEHLSEYYSKQIEDRAYFVLADEDDQPVGGIGFSRFSDFEDCAEIQKLYLSKETKGKGLGRFLLRECEQAARNHGFKMLYLETHSNLKEALRLYETSGFRRIDRPSGVQHGTMDLFYRKDLEEKEQPVIRIATVEDAERLLEIYGYYTEYTAISFEYEVPSLEEFQNRIQKTLEKYPYLVIEEKGVIQGYCYAGPFVGRAAYDWSSELSIYLDKHATKKVMGVYSTRRWRNV